MPLIVLTLVLGLVVAAPQRAPDLQLNLVAAAPPPERPSDSATTGGTCVSVSGGSPHVPNPLKVTLVDTDRLSYAVGDTMSFSVVVENMSDGPMVLGISRDPEVAPRRECRIAAPGVSFQVALFAMTRNGLGAMLASGFGFYGSPDAPGTTAVLQPGERARVQLPAQVIPGVGMVPTLTADLQPVRIKALVVIESESRTPSASSENTLQIELRAPTARLPHRRTRR